MDPNFEKLSASVDAADKKRRRRLAADNSDRSNVELVINTKLGLLYILYIFQSQHTFLCLFLKKNRIAN